MSTDLTPTGPTGKITLREAEAKIEALHGALAPVDGQPMRFCVPRGREATTLERRALSAVRERLVRELEPANDRRHIEVLVSRILLGFEKGRASDEDTRRLNAEFVEALHSLPLSAIHAAATRFRERTTLTKWDAAYRPSPAQFAAETREGMVPLRAKIIRIDRVLGAEVFDPPTDAEREQVQAAAAAWLNRGEEPPADRPRPSPEAIDAAREDALHEIGARFQRSASGGALSHLAARLDAKAPTPKQEIVR